MRTNHAADVPDIHRVAPLDLEHDLGRSIHIWLGIMIPFHVSWHSRAEIAQDRETEFSGPLEPPREIDRAPLHGFARGRGFEFGLSEGIKNSVIH